ncbi:coproporphyrinogen III oxidase [Solirubrobacter sp. CPCC 204708]|uniref:Heme chaperone HemW n=1 Tax=Solirubrobacter deserti TaxID=2282478 RepID=A0ABT4RU74_9ACTN|nr:radical SAM family heme chaperone HemW [Solirubrobacter deserti]MBE2318679.1 coproporphyrinogen III oxidase [Solirubrobacter deserti]MDA0142010.1 radical SAM family heme chaperone HemW [Solirubrobacter deserti]
MARLPAGDPAPADGALPAEALGSAGPFGFYVHVPFCATRCGYCDFNTYVPGERGAEHASGYVGAVLAEIDLAARVLGPRAVDTVFFGGGTPTLLSADDLIRVLRRIDERFGLRPGAEVTTEANPESVDPRKLEALRAAGFTRVSLGMQSAVPRILEILDRTHTPGRPEQAVQEARAAGFEQVSLDLIYGTPGETADEWRASLDAALSAEPDHLSTYSLVVEPGTRMAAQVRRGELQVPGEDVIVDRFETAERVLAEAGLSWYETCSWARDEAAWCRHNLGYWNGGDWWGAGPGAHSHVGGVRWWNVLHPRAWTEKLAAGISPAAARETPGADESRLERVMLGLRLRSGVALSHLTRDGRQAAQRHVAEGLLEPADHAAGRAVLTLRGRLLADPVTLDLAA